MASGETAGQEALAREDAEAIQKQAAAPDARQLAKDEVLSVQPAFGTLVVTVEEPTRKRSPADTKAVHPFVELGRTWAVAAWLEGSGIRSSTEAFLMNLH